MIDRDAMRKLAEERLERFIADETPRDAWEYVIRTTSGTTAAPLVCLKKTFQESRNTFIGTERAIFAGGAANMRLANLTIIRQATRAGNIHILSLGTAEITSAIAPLIEDFEPDTIRGFVPALRKLGEMVSRKCLDAIKSVYPTGELLTELVRAQLVKIFPHSLVMTLEYGLSETGLIGSARCRQLQPNQYHPFIGVSVEIYEPDETGIGELVATIERDDIEVRAYRSGDIARRIPDRCPCGAAETFEVYGRKGHDYVKFFGVILRKEEFDRVTAFFPHVIHDYQVVISEKEEAGKVMGSITMRIYYPSSTVSPNLVEEIRNTISKRTFVGATQTIEDIVAAGLCTPLQLELTSQPLSSSQKSGRKIVRLT